jgi:protein-tyrosine phosphatase
MNKTMMRVALGGGLLLGLLSLPALRRRRAHHPAPVIDAAALISEPLAPVTVTRLADGRLRFHWPVRAVRVALYEGLQTAAAEDSIPLATAVNASELLIEDPHLERHGLFTLRFEGGAWDGRVLGVAERFLPLTGAGNFRDLGGYETEDGRVVRWGHVFRSGDLSRLTPADLALLEGLPLRVVGDLRSAKERAYEPDLLPSSSAYHVLPVYEKEPMGALLRTVLFQRERLGEVMSESYPRMLEQGAPAYGALLSLLAEEENLPLVFHCSAGKDRAGIGAALLLKVLGVPEETIIADYSLSNRNFATIQADLAQNERLARTRISADDLQMVSVADPDWLRGLFRYVEAVYGSVEGYLREAAGVDEETLSRLRTMLLAQSHDARHA